MQDSIPGPQDHDLSPRQTLYLLSHPGAPLCGFLTLPVPSCSIPISALMDGFYFPQYGSSQLMPASLVFALLRCPLALRDQEESLGESPVQTDLRQNVCAHWLCSLSLKSILLSILYFAMLGQEL